jgi:hypothetical protein
MAYENSSDNLTTLKMFLLNLAVSLCELFLLKEEEKNL